MTLAAGSRLGAHEITAPLGAGGMGEVYRASDTKLGRDVAIKVLPAEVAGDAERLARFEREAKLLASLNHPNIAHVYGFESATLPDGSSAHFLAMELLEGEDLAERLKRGAIPVEEALEIARQIAGALEEAHEKGIVHRDLKPANVKLAPDGKVKVLDFGLAKAYTGDAVAGSGPDLSQSPTLANTGTQAGVILGTAAYMSPEQARGKPVDKRADIWAFGVVLFEMLTGRQLFEGETVSDVLAGVLAREIDWSRLPAATPPAVRHVLGRCLERDPRQRLRDVGDARHELLEPRATPVPIAAPATGQPRIRRTALPLAGAALAGAALALAVVAWRAGSTPRTPTVFTLPAPAGTRLEQVVISPDGRWLAFAAESASGERNLWLRRLDSRELRQIQGSEGAREPFWSPDSRFVGFFTESRLIKLEAATGALETVASVGNTRGGAWRPDGTIVFGGAKLHRVSVGGGAVATAVDADAATGENALRYPAFLTFVFSDDGTRAALGTRFGTGDGMSLTRLGSGAAPESLTAGEDEVGGPTPLDWHGRQLVCAPNARRSLKLVDLETGEDRTLVETGGDVFFGAISPDGRYLAYACNETGQWEVYVATFPRADARWRVSTSGGHQPRWNTRGSELFYLAPDRRLMSVRVRAGGSGFQWEAPRALFQTEIVDLGTYRGVWSYAVAPDGQRFLILTRRPQGPGPAVAILDWKPEEAL